MKSVKNKRYGQEGFTKNGRGEKTIKSKGKAEGMKRRIYQRRKDGDVKEEDEKENKKRSDKKERKIMALKSTHKKLR